MKKIRDDIHVAELFCSRLCHDLIAPLSAVNTGLELLQEMENAGDTDQADVHLLIEQSTKSALARLIFYRSSFGKGGDRMTYQEIKKSIESCYPNNKLQFTWDNIIGLDVVEEGWGRIILNLLMIVSDCAPRGGQLTINLPSREKKKLILNLIANPMVISDDIMASLKGEITSSDLSPRNIQAYLVFQLLSDLQAKLSVTSTENKMQIEVSV